MPGIDGLRFIEALRVGGYTAPILMISGYGTVDLAVRSLHLGADDFLTKPAEPEVLLGRVAALLEQRPVTEARDSDHGIVGRSPAIGEVLDRVRRVGPTETTVLISGETGVGKELVARAIHFASPRRESPLVVVNCGALAEGLLESELFGHVRGAFTGAVRERVGVFEAAQGGTIFLDEVGEMSLALQQRLLRVLQEREVTRVGTSRPVEVDVRVVAATNQDLRALIQEGRFREDLYYRLAVFAIDVPPLRNRADDIPLLVEHALSRLRKRVSSWRDLACSPFAMRALRSYGWPGNVRHLLSAIESAAVQAEGRRIEVQHLAPELRERLEQSGQMRYRSTGGADAERESIRQILEFSEGSVSRAADLLGMGRTTLWRKMKALGLSSRPIDEDAS
jgi:two-component system response regulator HydG